MTLLVALYLLDCVVAGVGLTYLSGADLGAEERLGYGAVLGAMAVTIAVFVGGVVAGFGGWTVVFGVIVASLTGGAGFAVGRRAVGDDLAGLVERLRLPWRSPRSLVPLVVVLAVSWPVTVRILSRAYQRGPDGGVLAGHLSVFGDWQAHLAYAASFAYGDGFDLGTPIAAGEDFSYHFGADLFAATLQPLGVSLPSALALTSGYLAFAFPVVMYVVGVRIVEQRVAAALAVVLFTMAGGWGFGRFFRDLGDLGAGVVWDLPRDYTRDFDTYWMDNPVLGHLYPQRPTLIGFPIALMAVALLWGARKTWSRRTFGFVGVLVGLTPMFHTFGWGTALVLGLLWAAVDRRVEWLWFAVPAVVLSLPALLWLLPPESAFRWHWGWVAGDGPLDIGWFWLLNTGLFAPLLAIALYRRDLLPPGVGRAFAPIWLWFVGAHLALPHPWEGNNSKYVIFWWMFGSFFVAVLLVGVARRARWGGPVVAAGLVLSLTLAGGLDLWKALDGTHGVYPVEVMSAGDVLVADWTRAATEPDDVFAVSPSSTGSPIPALAGRQVLTGFTGWVFDLGIPTWAERADATREILAGAPDAVDLARRWDVDYVVIGPDELRDGADPAFWAAAGTLVYDFGGFRVYEVPGRA